MLTAVLWFSTLQPIYYPHSGLSSEAAKRRNGALLLLPEINWSDIGFWKEEDEAGQSIVGEDNPFSDEILQFTRELRDALLNIDSQIKKDSEGTLPPAWTEAPSTGSLLKQPLRQTFSTVVLKLKNLRLSVLNDEPN